MNVVMLPHKNLQPVAVDLPMRVGVIHFCDTFETLASYFEHEATVDLVVIEREQLRAAFSRNVTIGDYMAKKGVPVLVVDDTVGTLSPDFDHARYPQTAVGVIPNEVIVMPETLGKLLRAVIHSVKDNPHASAQPEIYEQLKGLDLVLDPDFANQRGRLATQGPGLDPV